MFPSFYSLFKSVYKTLAAKSDHSFVFGLFLILLGGLDENYAISLMRKYSIKQSIRSEGRILECTLVLDKLIIQPND